MKLQYKRTNQARTGARKTMLTVRLDAALILKLKALAMDQRTSTAAILARSIRKEVRDAEAAGRA